MSNAIRFLESMGSNAAMANMSHADYSAVVAALAVDGEVGQAFMDRDVRRLEDALCERSKLFCLVFSPSEEEAPLSPDGETEEESPTNE